MELSSDSIHLAGVLNGGLILIRAFARTLEVSEHYLLKSNDVKLSISNCCRIANLLIFYAMVMI